MDIDIDHWNQIVLDAFPNEAVAFVKNNKLIALNNISPNPTQSFAIDNKEFIKHNPDAILHSHCYPLGKPLPHLQDLRTPSYSDFIGQRATNIPWGISSTEGEGVSEVLWFPVSRDAPLLKRPFVFYVSDCYTLIRDYYHQEMGIELNEYPDIDWWSGGDGVPEGAYTTNAEAFGFYEVPLAEVKKGDVIIMTLQKEYDHGGVYTGNGKILQHREGKLSAEYPIGRVGSFIRKAMRYNNV